VYRVRQEDLPFKGSSHEFVGADHGDVQVSVFLQVDVHLSPRFIQENL
jgi:hypothetical protein